MSDIATLMQEDPLKLSAPDFDLIISEMRAMRHKFNLGDTKAGSAKKKAAVVPKALAGADVEGLKGLLDIQVKL